MFLNYNSSFPSSGFYWASRTTCSSGSLTTAICLSSRTKKKQDPCPHTDYTCNPSVCGGYPNLLASLLLILRPSPQPSLFTDSVSPTIVNALNKRFWWASFMPNPVSSTFKTNRPFSYVVVSFSTSIFTLICPLNVNFREFPTKLRMICLSRVGSVLIVFGTSGCISSISYKFLISAFILSSTKIPANNSLRLTSSKTRRSSWKLDFVKSRMSWIRLSCRSQQ